MKRVLKIFIMCVVCSGTVCTNSCQKDQSITWSCYEFAYHIEVTNTSGEVVFTGEDMEVKIPAYTENEARDKFEQSAQNVTYPDGSKKTFVIKSVNQSDIENC